jgi:DNA-binding transcriptional LysR family regulator
MDFTQLKTFRLVAATGSFTQAAAALHYAQSSVTAHIQALEGDLGVQLFQRLPRRVVLTAAGARLLKEADTLLRQVEQVRQAVHTPAAPEGPFTLSALDTLCIHWLPTVFREFRSTHPEVRMVFRPAPWMELRRLVGDGVLDLALVLEEPIAEGALHVETLFPTAMVLVAPPDHPLVMAGPVRAQDLRGESLLLTERGCSYRNLFEHSLIAAGVHPGNALEFSNVEAIKQCVMVGLGITLLPELAVRREVARGQLRVLDWQGPVMSIQAQAICRVGSLESKAVRGFLAIARRHAEKYQRQAELQPG